MCKTMKTGLFIPTDLTHHANILRKIHSLENLLSIADDQIILYLTADKWELQTVCIVT
jgi:hypothetical protein